jgi:hypothetical protein
MRLIAPLAMRAIEGSEALSMGHDRSDFSVVVKSRGKPPTPWRWEIYCAGRASPVERSTEFYPTTAAASRAGKAALAQLLRKLQVRG